MAVSRDNIIQTARETVNVPWRHQGRTLAGIDCAGVIAYTGHKTGSFTYDFTSYRRRSQYVDMLSQFLDPNKVGCSRVIKSMVRPGDIVLLKDKMYPCHCGILGKRNGIITLINARYLDRVYEEEYNSAYMLLTLVGLKFPGVAD